MLTAKLGSKKAELGNISLGYVDPSIVKKVPKVSVEIRITANKTVRIISANKLVRLTRSKKVYKDFATKRNFRVSQLLEKANPLMVYVKDFEETLPVYFDYSNDLASETISSQTIQVSVKSGTDSTPQTFLQNASTQALGVVTQWVKGGVIGTVYNIRCKIVTSAGRELVEVANIEIVKF